MNKFIAIPWPINRINNAANLCCRIVLQLMDHFVEHGKIDKHGQANVNWLESAMNKNEFHANHLNYIVNLSTRHYIRLN